MHSAVQTAVVTIISYKPLSGLNFARYTEQYGSYMPSSPLGVYKPMVIAIIMHCLPHSGSRTVYLLFSFNFQQQNASQRQTNFLTELELEASQ